MIVQSRAVFTPSTHYCVFFYEAIPFLILDCVYFSLSFSSESMANSICFFAVVSH